MKNTVILTLMALFVVLMTTVASGQNKGQTQTFNYDYTHNYVVEWKEEDGKFNIKITKGEKSDSFIIEKELDNAVFTTAFMDVFKEVVLDKEIDDLALRKIIYQANEVRLHIKAQSLSNDDRPKAGDIAISKEVDIIKFTEDWRLKCNRVKEYRRTSSYNLDSMPYMIHVVVIPIFFESMLHLTKTTDDFRTNKATIGYAINEINAVLNSLDDMREKLDNSTRKKLDNSTREKLDNSTRKKLESSIRKDLENSIRKDLKKCLSYIKRGTIKQDELNDLNANFKSYEKDYRKQFIDFTTGVDPSAVQKTSWSYMRNSRYYRKKNVGTEYVINQYKVHEIKKEREYLLDIDEKKKEWSDLFLGHTHQRLKEKKDTIKQIKGVFEKLKSIEAKRLDIENKIKPIIDIDEQISELKASITKDSVSLVDTTEDYELTLYGHQYDKEYQEKTVKKALEKLKANNVDLTEYWKGNGGFDIQKFKGKKKNIRESIASALNIWFSDVDELEDWDFSDLPCKNQIECEKYRKEKLARIENKLNNIKNKIVYFNNNTKKQLESDIEKNKKRIKSLKSEQEALKEAIEKLQDDLKEAIEKLQDDSNYQEYFDNKLYNIDSSYCLRSLKGIKDSIKTDIKRLESRNQDVTKNIEYLKALSKKLEQQKAAIEKESIQQKFIVDSIQIEFYEGFIENIWVRGHLKVDKSRTLKFENRAPIGFSSKKAYDKNSTIWLTASDDDDAYWVLYMGELLTYLQHHENGTKDFSPANGTEEIKEFDKAIELRKQATFKILEAHVYSDFVGFNANSPNGLIQTEISKRFNLFTKRFGSFLRKDAVYCKCAGPRYGFNWGFGNFVRPSFVFSKFEDKERLLSVNAYHEIINGQLRSIKYVSTQDILQHEVFSVGALINVVTLDAPIQKSSLTLNAGFRFGRTELRDSVYQYKDNKISRVKEDNYGLNTVRGFLELDYRVTPQNRYGIGTSLRLVYMPIFTDNAADLYQYNRLDEYNDVKPNGNRWMVRFEASGFFKPAKDSDNKLFLRYRFHGQLNDLNYNFHQLQVGYSFYLLRNNVNVNKGTK